MTAERNADITLLKPGLIGEIGFLMIAVAAICVVLVESVALLFISRTMTEDLRAEAARTTEETVSILETPLYILDDDQCIRIGQTLLASGRISGIRLVSSYSQVLLDVPTSDPDSSLESTEGEIIRDGAVLGTFRLDFSDRQIQDVNSKILNVILWVILTVVVSISLAIRFVLVAKVTREINPIMETLTRIRGGDYSARIPETPYPDMERLVTNINEMAEKIEENRIALTRANQTLEQNVAERTEALKQSLEELEQTQDRLVHSEKMSALGNLSAGIAHELNTPLGAILSSNRLIVDFFNRDFGETLKAFSGLGPKSRERFLELFETARSSAGKQDMTLSIRKQRLRIEELLRQEGIDPREDLAEQLVELGITPGDELPVSWFRDEDVLELIHRAAPPSVARRMAEIVEIAGNKAANVVAALRSYLTPDDARQPGYLDLEAEIDKMLTLMQNLLKHGIEIQRDYAGIMVRGSPEKLGQVWLNIIRNAAQAMDFQGKLTLSTALGPGGAAVIRIGDTGAGIPEEIKHRVFEPFFSTKRYGEGMGIGLDICKRIVAGHGGTIEFESEPGRTVFTVTLPGAHRKESGQHGH